MEMSGHLTNSYGSVISLHVTLKEQLSLPTILALSTKYHQLKGLM